MIKILESDCQKSLEAIGLKEMDDFLNYKNEYCYKRNHYRAVYKIIGQNGKNVFLKIHYRTSFKMIMNMIFRLKISEAKREFESILRVRALGIKTLNPVGYGEKRVLGFPIHSFLLTDSMDKLPRLEDVVAKRSSKFSYEKKKAITRSLAEIVTKLHSQNLFHKDLYLGHILYDEGEEHKESSFYLIDLQRITEHNKRPLRWRIKDLASLNYSSDLCGVCVKDQIRFLKEYGRLMNDDYRRYLHPVARKTELIKKHTMKRYLKRNLKKKTEKRV